LRIEIFFIVILQFQLRAIAESGFDHGVGHVGHSDWLGRYTLGGTLEYEHSHRESVIFPTHRLLPTPGMTSRVTPWLDRPGCEVADAMMDSQKGTCDTTR
jgi:hypothetical protein